MFEPKVKTATEIRLREIELEITEILFELIAWICQFNPPQKPEALERLSRNNPKLYKSLMRYYELDAEDTHLRETEDE